jgi:hypothetical protein
MAVLIRIIKSLFKCFKWALVIALVLVIIGLSVAYKYLDDKKTILGVGGCVIMKRQIPEEHLAKCPQKLKAQLEELDIKDMTITLTFGSVGFNEMTLNFLCSTSAVSVSPVLVVGFDPQTCPALHDRHAQLIKKNPEYEKWKFVCLTADYEALGHLLLKTDPPSFDEFAAQNWTVNQDKVWYGSTSYFQLMLFRTVLVYQMLDCGFNVLFADSDIHFFSTPLPHLTEDNAYDLQFMADSTGVDLIDKVLEIPFANGGFIFMRPTEATKKFLRRVLYFQIYYNRNDQSAINVCLFRSDTLEWRILDQKLFANGYTYFREGKEVGDEKPILVHANWVSVKGKEAAMKEKKIWCLK